MAQAQLPMTLTGRPPRVPLQQPMLTAQQAHQQAALTMQMPRGQQLPRPVSFGMPGGGLTSTGPSLTAGNLQSFAALKEQADQMFQTTRAEQKTKEDLMTQLKHKDKEVQALSQTLARQQQRATQLAAELEKSEINAKKILERLDLLTRAHDQLLNSVQDAGAELKEGTLTTSELDARLQAQNNQIEDLAGKYNDLSEELVFQLDSANEQLETARKQLATATEKEREATMLLRQVQASADERKRDLDRAVEERDALQSKLRTFAMKSEDLTLQVSQANTAKEAADARWQAEVHRVQTDLAACRVQLDEARAQSSKHALTAQENDKRVAVLQAEARAITARTAELESQLAASQDAHRTLTQELADAQETVRTLTEQVAAAKAAGHDTEQALVEARAAQQELTERFNQVEAALKAEQDAKEELTNSLTSAQATHAETLAKAQEEAAALRKQVEDAQAQVASLEEKHRKELSAATANAGALNKQQMDMRIQKAVEANSKQAQKALDELKKKSAAELKKVQDELKKATDKLTTLNKTTQSATAAKEAAERAAKELQAAVQEAVERERAAAADAVRKAQEELRVELAAAHEANMSQATQALQADLQAKLTELQRTMDAKLTEARESAVQQTQRERQQVEERLQQALRELKKAKEDEEALRAQLKSHAASAGALNDVQTALQERANTLAEELAASKAALDDLRNENTTLKKAKDDIAAEKEKARVAEVEKAKAAQEAAVRELEAVRTQMSTATAEHTAAEKLIAQLREENTKLKRAAEAPAPTFAVPHAVMTASQPKSRNPPPRFNDNTALDSHMAAVDAPAGNALDRNNINKRKVPEKTTRIYTDMDSDTDSQVIRSTGIGGFFRGSTPVQYSKRSKGVEKAQAPAPAAPPAARPANTRSLFSGAVAKHTAGSQQVPSSLRTAGGSVQPSQGVSNLHRMPNVVIATQGDSGAVAAAKVPKASGRSGRTKSTLLPNAGKATLTSKDKDKSAATTGRAKPAAAGGQNSEGLFSMFG